MPRSPSPQPTDSTGRDPGVLVSRYRFVVVAIYGIAALLAAVLLASRLSIIDDHVTSLARERGEVLFRLIQLTRAWNAGHGGVYVPVTEDTLPNPHLRTPTRDVFTTDRQVLTLVNPAYMTRQIAEIAEREEGLRFHITSLKPVRAANGPDAWEEETLSLFENAGLADRLSFFPAGEGLLSGPEHRYMAPLITTQACMGCHAVHGYTLGEIRGGISVTMPAGDLLAIAAQQRQSAVAAHVLVALIAAGLAHLAASQARRALLTWQDRNARSLETARLLEAQAESLRTINQELEIFASVASHDLRQPLRMVNGSLCLVRRRLGGDIDADTSALVDQALDSTRRMDRLILDLLDYARTGRNAAPQIEVPAAQVLETCLVNLQVLIEETGATVTLAPDPPDLIGHEGDLVRLFQNLIGNALRYRAPTRHARVDVGWMPGGDDTVILFVRDNGIGIPTADRERIFQAFQRADPRPGVDSGEGSGIGLAVCKKIVEAHRGSLWVTSEVNEGSTFFIRLPGRFPAPRHAPQVLRRSA